MVLQENHLDIDQTVRNTFRLKKRDRTRPVDGKFLVSR